MTSEEILNLITVRNRAAQVLKDRENSSLQEEQKKRPEDMITVTEEMWESDLRRLRFQISRIDEKLKNT
jgi:hypothetical protein